MVNISATGMCIRSMLSLSPQSLVEGTLSFGNGRVVSLKAIVKWSTPRDYERAKPAEMGLELLEIPEEYLAGLAELFAG